MTIYDKRLLWQVVRDALSYLSWPPIKINKISSNNEKPTKNNQERKEQGEQRHR